MVDEECLLLRYMRVRVDGMVSRVRVWSRVVRVLSRVGRVYGCGVWVYECMRVRVLGYGWEYR
jgi:hypothetical protein